MITKYEADALFRLLQSPELGKATFVSKPVLETLFNKGYVENCIGAHNPKDWFVRINRSGRAQLAIYALEGPT